MEITKPQFSLLITLIVLTLFSCTQNPTKKDAAKQPTKYLDITDNTSHDLDTINYLKSRWPKQTTFTEANKQILQQALNIGNEIIKDSLFLNILKELDQKGKIEWGSSRISSLPSEARQAPGAFILEQFRLKGLNKLEEFQAYEWRPGSSTTASSYCDNLPKINVNRLDRDLDDISGTIIHERIHTFCQIHLKNTRSGDLCDFAYIAGDLSIAIYNYRAAGSKPFATDSKICQTLREILKEHHLIL